jgi:hypothetical protein
MITARLVLPKYGGRKGSKAENEDAPAEAGASCLFFASSLAKGL